MSHLALAVTSAAPGSGSPAKHRGTFLALVAPAPLGTNQRAVFNTLGAKGGFGHFSPAPEAPPVLPLIFRSVGSHPALARVPQLCLGLGWLWAGAHSSHSPRKVSSSPVGLLLSSAQRVAELWVTAVLPRRQAVPTPRQDPVGDIAWHKVRLFGCSSLDSELETQHVT